MDIAVEIILRNKPNPIVEILFDTTKLSIEWIILELAFDYKYLTSISNIRIIKYWVS